MAKAKVATRGNSSEIVRMLALNGIIRDRRGIAIAASKGHFSERKKGRYKTYSFKDVLDHYGGPAEGLTDPAEIFGKTKATRKRKPKTVDAKTSTTPSAPDQGADRNGVQSEEEELLELQELLKTTRTAPQKVSVEKGFWEAKDKKMKYLLTRGDVVPVEVFQEAVEVGVSNFKTKMYTIPNRFKTLYPHVSTEAVDRLHAFIDEAFEELYSIKDTKVE